MNPKPEKYKQFSNEFRALYEVAVMTEAEKSYSKLYNVEPESGQQALTALRKDKSMQLFVFEDLRQSLYRFGTEGDSFKGQYDELEDNVYKSKGAEFNLNEFRWTLSQDLQDNLFKDGRFSHLSKNMGNYPSSDIIGRTKEAVLDFFRVKL